MEKNRLTFLALVTAAVFGGCFGVFLLATNLYDGIVERQDKIDRLQQDQIAQNLLAAKLLKEKKQVDRVRATALPGNVPLATNLYKSFLLQLLLKNKFDYKSLTEQASTRSALGARGPQAPFVNVLSYDIQAEATLGNLVAFLQDFYRVNLPHLVRSFSIESGGKGNDVKHTIRMKIDALSMSGIPDRESLFPVPDWRVTQWETVAAWSHAPTGVLSGLSQFATSGLYGGPKLASATNPSREYSGVLAKNVFSGLVPKESQAASKDAKVPDLNILKETSLARISSNFVTDEGELRVWPTNKYVKLRAEGGINTFEIKDANDLVVLKGKVLAIKPRDVVFETRGKYYVLHIGQKLDDALKNELTFEDAKKFAPDLITVVENKEPTETEKDNDKE